MTDEELAARLKRLAPVVIPRGPLLEAAADRIYALSAHVALLKSSLAQAEREAEKPAASAEPFGYFRALPFGWDACSETDEGAIALYEHPAPAASSEPVAWAKENGAVTFDAFRASCWKSNADKVVALYSAPQPDRVAELNTEVERLRTALSRLLTSDPDGAIANASADQLRAAVAAEREACAKVCDEISSDYCTRELRRFAELRTDAEIGAGKCAAEIRARGAKGGE